VRARIAATKASRSGQSDALDASYATSKRRAGWPRSSSARQSEGHASTRLADRALATSLGVSVALGIAEPSVRHDRARELHDYALMGGPSRER
jgi:hypothetical protein